MADYTLKHLLKVFLLLRTTKKIAGEQSLVQLSTKIFLQAMKCIKSANSEAHNNSHKDIAVYKPNICCLD